MYQCILNVPLWIDWNKVTYSQVHGSPVLKTLFLQSFSWISPTRFAELTQFWQDPICRRNTNFRRKKFSVSLKKDFIFRFHIYFSASFASFFLVSDILYIYIYVYIYICIYYIYRERESEEGYTLSPNNILTSLVESNVEQFNKLYSL